MFLVAAVCVGIILTLGIFFTLVSCVMAYQRRAYSERLMLAVPVPSFIIVRALHSKSLRHTILHIATSDQE